MPTSDKRVIEIGINEGRMRDDNPNVPFSPEEIAADAQRSYDAGAAVIHYHGRGPQGESMAQDSATNIETQRKIRDGHRSSPTRPTGANTKSLAATTRSEGRHCRDRAIFGPLRAKSPTTLWQQLESHLQNNGRVREV